MKPQEKKEPNQTKKEPNQAKKQTVIFEEKNKGINLLPNLN